MHSTTQGQSEWMRMNNFAEAKIRDYVRTAKIGPVRFMPGPFGIFAGVKRAAFWLLDLWKTIGMPPLSRQDLFKWATKSTSLASSAFDADFVISANGIPLPIDHNSRIPSCGFP